jgi:hypothetical protein
MQLSLVEQRSCSYAAGPYMVSVFTPCFCIDTLTNGTFCVSLWLNLVRGELNSLFSIVPSDYVWRGIKQKVNHLGTTPYSLRASASLDVEEYTCNSKGGKKTPETPNAPYRAARIRDETWRSAGPAFEPGRAGPRLSLTHDA